MDLWAGPAKGASTLTKKAVSTLSEAAREAPATPSFNELLAAVHRSLEDSKADDSAFIDLTGKTALADAMIVATGRSTVHVGAIADRVIKACRDAGFPTPKVEGAPLCDWVLLDARDAIVHIFRPDVRQFYNLEKIWGADRPGEGKGR